MTLDLLTPEAITHDGPTAAMRLDIAIAGLPHTTGEIVGELVRHGVKGQPHQLDSHPLEVYLSARVGAYVGLSGVNVTIRHDDWCYQMKTPTWLADFYNDCIDGLHPLVEGAPCVGDVQPVDIFAGRH